MEQQIRHRRLYAFYNSKALNVLLLIGVLSLLQTGYSEATPVPAIACSAVAFILFIGYTLWIWIKKPKQIIINTWLSNLTIWFTLYYLIIIQPNDLSWWWFATPVMAAIIIYFIDMIRPHDELFEIKQ